MIVGAVSVDYGIVIDSVNFMMHFIVIDSVNFMMHFIVTYY